MIAILVFPVESPTSTVRPPATPGAWVAGTASAIVSAATARTAPGRAEVNITSFGYTLRARDPLVPSVSLALYGSRGAGRRVTAIVHN